jgi:Ser/Thr protein kinase RdoA (MazF antagonist)
LAAELEWAYGLSNVHCQLIKAVILDTYQVWASSGTYILRVYPAQRRTESAIRAELAWLAHLHAVGVPVSVPIAPVVGDDLLVFDAPEGPRYGALFTYAAGQPLSQHRTPVNVRAYGHLLAQVHAAADTLPHPPARPSLDLSRLLDQPLLDLETVFAQRMSDWTFLRQTAEVIRPQFEALPTKAPWYGLCHGDAGSANVHIASDGTLTLFDFDFCGPGWRVYDISTFLIEEPEEIISAFLEGYQAVRALTTQEQACIPLCQVVQNIWVLGMRANYVNEWGTTHFSERLVNHILAFIRRTMDRLPTA